MDIVNELTAYEINMVFKDTKGQPVTPDSANYRITDDAGSVIVATTPITVDGSTAQIVISSAVNVCTESGGNTQKRRVVIQSYGLAQTVHEYSIKRVK